MFRNYLKIAFRNLKRNATNSIINILGLSLGIACSVLIVLWVTNELSYDRFHINAEEIYRVVGDDDIVGKMATSCGPLADYMKDNYPEVVNSARYMPSSVSPFKYKNKMFNIDNGVFADPAFFKIFSFSFIQGNPDKALSDILNVVISESMAKKFFDNENPVGKTILINGQDPLIVSAVIKDPPANSQFQFDYILHPHILKYIGFPIDTWNNAGFHTFIQVRRNTDIQKLNSEISDIMPKQIPGFNRKLFLQPLTDIHLNTDFAYDLSGLGDKKYLYIFSMVALFLMLIACINYINLSTAGALKRSKEVGLRKMMGSNRYQIIKQFFVESLIIVIISFIIAIVLVEILFPLFNQISGKNLIIEDFDTIFLYGAFALLLIVSFLTGGYPAFLISSIKPVNSLKNILNDGQRGSLFRKILVVVQFSLSIMLIAGTITVYHQLNYIKSKKLGFDKENILFFKAKGKFQQNYDSMKNEMLKQSSIIDVTAENKLFTNFSNSTTNINWEGKESKADVNIEYSHVDYNYFNMLNVGIVDGRNFSDKMSTDINAFVLNQEAVNQIKLIKPINKKFSLNNIEGKIIGVVNNANFKSLHHKIVPKAYLLLENYSELTFTYNGIILVKTSAGKVQDAIQSIENIWNEVNPNLPFEYHFMDEAIDKQYTKEIQTVDIFSYFSLIAIMVSCMGLYGLVVFMAENRIKEIGIRKVLGASVSSILKMFYQNFTKLILLSNLIAIPLAWYGINKWLQNFAYRIDLSWWVFALSGGIALLIALGTVSFQAIKAATANPVESLRNE